MKKGFSIVELMIVVAILGILAAIAVPAFQSHTTDAKSAAAKTNLHPLRATAELYAARHGAIGPGYPADDASQTACWNTFWAKIVRDGKYLQGLPKNPFNKKQTILMVQNGESMPSAATGSYGWVYKAATKDFRLDWPGTDSKGMRYFDY